MNPEALTAAQTLWDYHLLHHRLEKSDCLLVLGSNDPRVAEWGADLFRDGWAPLMVISGHEGVLTRGLYGTSEAEHFADIAVRRGVPRGRILVENRATNTGENILFSKALLEEKGLDPERFILVQKPYMERRTFATFQKLWPGKHAVVTSPPIRFADYPTPDLPLEHVIQIMVGDFQRILIYPARGFQVEQPVTPEARAAYETLIRLGFDRHLARA